MKNWCTSVGALLVAAVSLGGHAPAWAANATALAERQGSGGLSGLGGELFARQAEPGIITGWSIPFQHPERPTIDAIICGEPRPLLFDTGTFTCLLRLDDEWPRPRGVRVLPGSEALARLEGKRPGQAGGVVLDYGAAGLVSLGGVRLRDVPFRLYSGGADAERDYAGAFAPYLLRQWVIEVSNSESELRLHERTAWLPPSGARMLPLLILPRGVFVPLVIGGEQYWFHLDTGFSGGIGLTAEVLYEHPEAAVRLEGEAEHFQGWRLEYSYDPLVIKELELLAYPGLGWAQSSPLVLRDVAGIAYRPAYKELDSYHIGGIAGSGFWQHFDYALDFELCRMYVWQRDAVPPSAGAERGNDAAPAGE